jgi:DNA-directed RNA polymerase-3 subunit RPC5
MADIDLEQYDPDPIKATYDVYIKPRISDDREIYVLQFPNRDAKQHYSNENESQPLKLRIKPEAGMLEVDVPLDVWRNFDREKGIKWGDAMKKSNMTKGGGSYGMPGAFGMGGAQPSGRGRARELEDDVNQQRLLQDYEAAVQQDHVLRKQTLGGQTVPNEDTTPQYMIGVWRESKTLVA